MVRNLLSLGPSPPTAARIAFSLVGWLASGRTSHLIRQMNVS